MKAKCIYESCVKGLCTSTMLKCGFSEFDNRHKCKKYIQRNANIYEFITKPCSYLYNNPNLICTLDGTIDRDCFNIDLTICKILLKKQNKI